MLNHPLLLALCGIVLTSVVSYLINQLPTIKQFPGKNALVVTLTIEAIILVGIYSLWNTTEDKTHELEVVLASVGGLTVVLLIWHTFKLIWMLKRTTTGNSSSDNTTTKLKSPNDWRRELLQVMKNDVEIRLKDSLYDNKIIRVATEDRNLEIGRNPLKTSAINNQPSFIDNFLQPLRSLEVFGGGKTQLATGKLRDAVCLQPLFTINYKNILRGCEKGKYN
ncbi:MAG: hypothetical protein AAF915_13735 [Cyanobacteria bacterium P01_D01_bin.50]